MGQTAPAGSPGRLIQLQNLYKNTMPDLHRRGLWCGAVIMKPLSMLYEDIPDTLSQLIPHGICAAGWQETHCGRFFRHRSESAGLAGRREMGIGGF